MLAIIEELKSLVRSRTLTSDLDAATAALHNAEVIEANRDLPPTATGVYGPGGPEAFRLAGPVVVYDAACAVLISNASRRPRGLSGAFGYVHIDPGPAVVSDGAWATPHQGVHAAALTITWGFVSRIRYESPERSLCYTASLAIAGRYLLDLSAGQLLAARRNSAVLNEVMGESPGFPLQPLAEDLQFTPEEHRDALIRAVYAIQHWAFSTRAAR